MNTDTLDRTVAPASPDTTATVLQAVALRRDYPVSRGLFQAPAVVHALDGVSFGVAAGRTLAVVGESGCGKSTLARLLTMIEPPTAGQLLIDGQDVATADEALKRQLRRQIQIVFQNPYGSLNPRQTVGAALMEPLLVNGLGNRAEREHQAREMLRQVGLREEHFGRYPHMFSGGQRQRVAIARALMLHPRVLVLDEPVSALDVSIRAQVLNLLDELQERLHVAYVFISHDLGVVRHVADEVLVMYLGRCVESGPRDAVFESPRHPYTRALLSATPTVDPAQRRERILLKGELPSPIDRPSGCPFRTRCPLAFDRCAAEMPPLAAPPGAAHPDQRVACWAVEAGRS
ncbi:MAG: dipeptide ABC transporter ATP-binding protein [Burkholderiales bacterium]|nr:dipeptide ABC transporter ATP-binding protein [Burkholderiales bacterium]